MKNNFFNFFKPSVLISFIAIMAVLLFMAKSHFGLAIATTSFIGTLLFLITKYLWKYKPFKCLFWINDFSGRYEGILRFRYIDKNGVLQTGTRKHIKIVNQTGYRISIASFALQDDGTPSSPSYDKGVFVEQTEDECHFKLLYTYLNEGNIQLGFPPHYGTDVLKFIRNKTSKSLSGYYYTNRDPQTRGDYEELKWVSNNLKHEF
jgi:hypothetical protein